MILIRVHIKCSSLSLMVVLTRSWTFLCQSGHKNILICFICLKSYTVFIHIDVLEVHISTKTYLSAHWPQTSPASKKFLELGEGIFFLFSNSSLERIRYNFDSLESIPQKSASTQSSSFISCFPPYSHALFCFILGVLQNTPAHLALECSVSPSPVSLNREFKN